MANVDQRGAKPANLGVPKLSATFRYVLITPAHNEEKLIAQTIECVLDQTVRPIRWVVVSDASKDRTAEIAEKYAAQHGFITVVNLERTSGRNFGRKALAFNRGIMELGASDYDYIGNLDADMSFEPDYFQRVLAAFAADPLLGISGGIVCMKTEDGFITEDATLDSVGGAVQLFRKECFEAIGGGYLPLEYGGIDTAAEIIARMEGWKVRKLPDNRAYEGRQTGTADRGILRAKVRAGQRLHSLGYGAGFFFLRCAYRVMDRPALLGSTAALVGYFSSIVRHKPIVLPPEVVDFWRRERRHKMLRAIFSRLSASRVLRNNRSR